MQIKTGMRYHYTPMKKERKKEKERKEGRATREKIFWEVGLCIPSHSTRHLGVHYVLSNLVYLT